MNTLFSTLIFIFAGLSLAGQASAASSQWQDLGGGKARILASKNPDTNAINGVIEVKLDKGWKTYWRSPGGSGIPPEFNFSSSNGFSLDNVTFPVPKWIELNGAAFFGYTDQVSFVFSGMAEDVSTSINLDMLIGVCEEICIPATASFELSTEALNSSDPQMPIRLQLANAKLPATTQTASKFVEFKLDGNQVSATLVEPVTSDRSRIIIAVRDSWVSDPVEFGVSGNGINQASITIPDSIMKSVTPDQNWEFSLIQQSKDTPEVTKALEGSFTMGQK